MAVLRRDETGPGPDGDEARPDGRADDVAAVARVRRPAREHLAVDERLGAPERLGELARVGDDHVGGGPGRLGEEARVGETGADRDEPDARLAGTLGGAERRLVG